MAIKMNFDEPKIQTLSFCYSDGNRDKWIISVNFAETKESPYKNDEEYYSSVWNIFITREGKEIPIDITISTQYDALPTQKHIAIVIQEYFSHFAFGFACHAKEIIQNEC